MADVLGFSGVGLILTAYFLNVFGYWEQTGGHYLLVNFTGAGLACWSSVLIHSVPFTILEGAWALVSLAGILRYLQRKLR